MPCDPGQAQLFHLGKKKKKLEKKDASGLESERQKSKG